MLTLARITDFAILCAALALAGWALMAWVDLVDAAVTRRRGRR